MKRIIALLLLLSSLAVADELKLATWNIQFLKDGINEGPNPRDQVDFDRLASYADILDADIIAFQEVKNTAAAAKVFDASKYQIFVSTRNSVQRTGFAVRQGISVTHNPDFDALNVTGFLRHGTDLTIHVGGTDLRLLSVHMKSGCFDDPLFEDPVSTLSDACQKLNQQVPVLEAWIDQRATDGMPFIISGDFNRRFDADTDDFWPVIDDGKPHNADVYRPTLRQEPLCWNRDFDLFIDHFVFDKQSTRWIQPFTFVQIVYQEDDTLKMKLSDHCPIAVVVDVP